MSVPAFELVPGVTTVVFGPNGAGKTTLLRRLVAELDVPLTVRQADVRKLAEAAGRSIEMAARQARHAFFAEFNDAVIALAHHADDQAETVIDGCQ